MRSHNNPSTTMTDRTPLMVGGKQASGFTARGQVLIAEAPGMITFH